MIENRKKQVYNPFLPLHEYIPDGEPHVFGDRVYHFGSHDKEGGYTFCMLDYVVYSAPVTDLTDWRYEGVIYRAEQDPNYEKTKYMYAPDVVRGNDGKYYLYYCMGGDYGIGGYQGGISVAVSDSPAGTYEFLGHVKNPDGSLMKKYICFDPAVMNDNGTIRLYYGTQYGYEEEEDFLTDGKRLLEEMEMFARSKEEILSYSDSIMGPVMAVLEDDMLTVKEEAKHIIPYRVKGTTFEAHPFFEGASIRKVKDTYYFIYSSWQNHELCYATSQYPDKEFVFGGTIVSNGDVGYQGRTVQNKLNMTGTTHGSMECINGEWYIFYHRLTHKSDYSRQACAEHIVIQEDGFIPQVEMTSCGLNKGSLVAQGSYPAVIACNLTNGNMPHGSNSVFVTSFPNVTNIGEERFIGEIQDQTLIGYKYFQFDTEKRIGIRARWETEQNRVVFNGPVRIDERCEKDSESLEEKLSEKMNRQSAKETDAVPYVEIRLKENGAAVAKIMLGNEAQGDFESDKKEDDFVWREYLSDVSVSKGQHALYLIYHGEKNIQLKEIFFED